METAKPYMDRVPLKIIDESTGIVPAPEPTPNTKDQSQKKKKKKKQPKEAEDTELRDAVNSIQDENSSLVSK